MAVTGGYFNSVNGDRKYNADQMSEYFEGIINEGVCQHIGGGLAVTAGTGLSVVVATGKAFIGQKWLKNDATLTLTISAASESYSRIDAVVIRKNNAVRSCQIAVKVGTPAASPVAPTMTRDSTTYEMALAYVNVAAGASSVTVTDKRSDSSVCGWAAVAQATSGEVDQMLNDMKTGFDGVVYSSPVQMVNSCDQKLQDQIENTAKSIVENEYINIYSDTVSGTTYVNVPVSIPAGSYIFKASNIESNDTNSSLCRVVFFNGNTTLADFYCARIANYETTFTLASAADKIYFYASDSMSHASGDTFSFGTVQVGDPNTNLHNDITELKAKTNYTLDWDHEEIALDLTVGYLAENGTIASTATDYVTSQFFTLANYDWLVANVNYGYSAVAYNLYNQAGQVIYSKKSASAKVEQIKIVVSEILQSYPTAKQIRFSGGAITVGNGTLRLRVYSNTNKAFVGEAAEVAAKTSNILYGKKIAFCGDSFTSADNLLETGFDGFRLCYKSFAWWIADRNNMNLYNDGISGSTMHIVNASSPATNSPFAYQRYLNVPNDCDYIILQFGLNETTIANSASTRGTKESTDTQTMWGSWNTVLAYLIEHHPAAKIGIICSDAWMTENYYNTLKDICEWWGIPLLDLGGDANLPLLIGGRRAGSGLEVNPDVVTARNNEFAQNPAGEDLHPNAEGHKYRSTIIEHWIRGL